MRETIETIVDIKEETATVKPTLNLNKKPEKNLGGRPRNEIYEANMPIYIELMAKHLQSGGAVHTFSGLVFDHFYGKGKDVKKAMLNTPGRDWFYERLNPDSPYYDKVFSDVVNDLSSVRDYFWQHKAVVIPEINSSKYQLYMANNYGWRTRQDVTSQDQKLDAPVIYKPEKHEVLEGVVIEDNTLLPA